MGKKDKKNKLLPPVSDSELSAEEQLILKDKLFIEIMNAVPDMVMVVNETEQIVYCNKYFLESWEAGAIKDVLGKRPGQAMHCINACDDILKYGTSPGCEQCGMMKAYVASRNGGSNCQECRITQQIDSKRISYDLRLWVKPVKIGGKKFTVITMQDIADEKRRSILQRIFFHDVVSDIFTLSGYLYKVEAGKAIDEDSLNLMRSALKRVSHALEEQKDLILAEQGDLQLSFEEFPVCRFLEDLVNFYSVFKYARQRELILDCTPKGEDIINSDRVLLGRIMGNLIKNALEATEENVVVSVGFKRDGGKKIFSVHNRDVMPGEVQSQIFQRSFSTKGNGRGLGTYSVKILAEQYLKGKAYFESKEGLGTVFYVELG